MRDYRLLTRRGERKLNRIAKMPGLLERASTELPRRYLTPVPDPPGFELA